MNPLVSWLLMTPDISSLESRCHGNTSLHDSCRDPQLHQLHKIRTDLSNLVDVAGHNADLAGVGGNNTGAIGSNQASLILSLQSTDNLHPMSHHRFEAKYENA